MQEKHHKSHTFLANEWQAPAEHVHEIRQPLRVRHVELLDAEHVHLVLDYCCLVIVVVWCGEERHDTQKACLATLSIHPVPVQCLAQLGQ